MPYQVNKFELVTIRSGALPASGDWDTGAVGTGFAECPCYRGSFVDLDAVLTKHASATSNTAELIVERSPVSSGNDWQPAESSLDASGTPSGGVLVAGMTVLHRTLTTTGTLAVSWHVATYGAERLRVRARETGDTTNRGTLVVRARTVAVGA